MIDERGAITLFIRRLYAKGKLSIQEAYQAAAREEAERGTGLHMGNLEAQCSLPMEQAVAHLEEEQETRRVAAGVSFPEGPILVVATDLSAEQEKVLGEWRKDGGGQWNCGFNEGEYLVLDSIKWKFGPGWRNLYPEIPCC